MLRQKLRLKRAWIYAAVVAVLVIIGVERLDSWPTTTVNPSTLAFTAGAPSAASLRSAPTYGTRITFEDSAALAFARAEREDKLVLLIHLSGRFGSSETT